LNATVGLYAIPPNGTAGPPIPNTLIIIPSQFVRLSSSYDVAIVRLPNGPNNFFNFTAGNNVSIANFPTSTPLRSEPIFAVAFGNQNPGGPLFPVLKVSRTNLKRNSICTANLTTAGITRFNASINFCVSSKTVPTTSNATFEGVCGKDIGGAIVRTADITNPITSYYEVLGLISYANDTTTCNQAAPVPVIVIYIWPYVNGFFGPILGSLSDVGNKFNAALNPNSKRGNFICGNQVKEGIEQCDPTTTDTEGRKCCDEDSCAYRFVSVLCEPKVGKPNKCLQRFRCTRGGVCQKSNKTITNKPCPIGTNEKGGICSNGVCVAKKA